MPSLGCCISSRLHTEDSTLCNYETNNKRIIRRKGLAHLYYFDDHPPQLPRRVRARCRDIYRHPNTPHSLRSSPTASCSSHFVHLGEPLYPNWSYGGDDDDSKQRGYCYYYSFRMRRRSQQQHFHYRLRVARPLRRRLLHHSAPLRGG